MYSIQLSSEVSCINSIMLIVNGPPPWWEAQVVYIILMESIIKREQEGDGWIEQFHCILYMYLLLQVNHFILSRNFIAFHICTYYCKLIISFDQEI